MKYVIKDKDTEHVAYPYYGESKDKSIVVFFTSKKTGVVIFRNNNAIWNIGDRPAVWDEASFTPLPKGTVLEVTI